MNSLNIAVYHHLFTTQMVPCNIIIQSPPPLPFPHTQPPPLLTILHHPHLRHWSGGWSPALIDAGTPKDGGYERLVERSVAVEDEEVGGESLEKFPSVVGGDSRWRVWGWLHKEGLGGPRGVEGVCVFEWTVRAVPGGDFGIGEGIVTWGELVLELNSVWWKDGRGVSSHGFVSDAGG